MEYFIFIMVINAVINRKNIKTVSEINKEIQVLFDQNFLFIRILGEVSNLHRPLSGHMYFNLKDDKAQIKAVLFKNRGRYLRDDLQNGQQVICDGRIALYSPRGDYQIVVESVDFQGIGDLQLTFSRLKEKLLSDGLFEPSHKLSLPSFSEKIILITSPTGAAVHDFLSICKKRNSNISIGILPVRVQGDGSAKEIANAISKACDLSPDAIVLCRGGGSIEDLWSFNEEIVARAIYKANIPIVTGIGHETDFTIADFCSDTRCATPTAAAELLVPETKRSINLIENLLNRLNRALLWRFESAQSIISRANRVFSSFDSAFYNKALKLDVLTSRLFNRFSISIERNNLKLQNLQARLERQCPIHDLDLYHYRVKILRERLIKQMSFHIDRNQSRFQEITAILDSVSPLATLSRGYSIVSKTDSNGNKAVVTDSSQVNVKEKISVKLKKGEIDCIVSNC